MIYIIEDIDNSIQSDEGFRRDRLRGTEEELARNFQVNGLNPDETPES